MLPGRPIAPHQKEDREATVVMQERQVILLRQVENGNNPKMSLTNIYCLPSITKTLNKIKVNRAYFKGLWTKTQSNGHKKQYNPQNDVYQFLKNDGVALKCVIKYKI